MGNNSKPTRLDLKIKELIEKGESLDSDAFADYVAKNISSTLIFFSTEVRCVIRHFLYHLDKK